MFTAFRSYSCPSCCFFKEVQLCHRANKSRALRLHLSGAYTWIFTQEHFRHAAQQPAAPRQGVVHNKTRSFTAKFRLFSNQLWCDCNVGTYSRIHWDQKQSAIKWACLHCLCECSSLAKTSRGIKRFHHCRRWFGMRVFTSFRSSLEGQIERLFKMDVTSANTVHKVSSPTRVPWSPRTAFITFLTSNKPLPYYWHVACCRRLETPLWQGASLPFYFTRM